MTYSHDYSPYTLGKPHFFHTIDSERPAYWLGFLAADGYVRGNRLQLVLSGNDRGLIEQFRADLQATNPIYDSAVKGHSIAKICISCPHLTRDLRAYGITRRKTYTLAWPPNIPDCVIHHFIRGYVDGDGGFYATRNKYAASPNIQFRVCSTLSFLQSMQSHLMQSCNLRQTKIYQDKRRPSESGTLIYTGRLQVKRILDYLYHDATIWLPRKRDKIEPYL